MSQQVDANLVELARKWGSRFMYYRKVFLQLGADRRPWWIDLMFYRSLIALGCTPVGRFSAVYTRCSDKVLYYSIEYMFHYYHIKDVKALEGDIEEINKLKPLTLEEVDELRDKLVRVSVDFVEFIRFGVYVGELIHLLRLEDIDLFLTEVMVTFNEPIFNASLIQIWIDAVTSRNEKSPFMQVTYVVKEDGAVSREGIRLWPIAEQIKKTKGIGEEDVLRALNKKYLAIEGLLKGAEEVVLNGIKSLAILLLY